MIKQRKLIHSLNWDILILLDACRYDTFKEVYKEIFDNGNLKKAISPTTFTFGWFVEMFNNTPPFDGIFVSSDYEVANSGGIEVKIHDRAKRKKYCNRGFDVQKQFPKIIDIWKQFDKKLGMMHPKVTTEEAIKCIKANPKERFIIDYWQIHDPYIYYLGNIKPKDLKDVNIRYKSAYKWVNLKKFIGKFISDETLWNTMMLLGKEPNGGLAELWFKFGKEGIIKGYKEDLKLTLKYIKKIVDEFPDKKIVITSDHGELLGEYERYGHAVDKRYKELLEVPWFEI